MLPQQSEAFHFLAFFAAQHPLRQQPSEGLASFWFWQKWILFFLLLRYAEQFRAEVDGHPLGREVAVLILVV